MNPDNIKKLVLGILLLLAVGVVLKQLVFTGSTTPPPPPTATSKNAAAAPGAPARPPARPGTPGAAPPATFQEVEIDIDALLEDIEVVNFDYRASHIDRDPMTPLVGIVRPQEQMDARIQPTMMDVLNKKVTGIIFDPNAPAAVVDDEVVHEGYVYPDGTIVHDIERDRVVFKIGDSLIPVDMKKLGMR